jgi:uncharacterized protein YfbU (UPF0304 family)
MLTRNERALFWHQFEILKHLDNENADSYGIYQEALERGYTTFYSFLDHIDAETVSEAQMREVDDILSMYRMLGDYYTNGGGQPLGTYFDKFRGFDGNNETAHYSYANFLINKLKHWAEQSKAELNSHAPHLSQYLAMTKVWQATGGLNEPMTDRRVEEIMKAGGR